MTRSVPEPVLPNLAPLPRLWLPTCKMVGIVAHWSAGGYRASEADKEHYHVIVEGDGVYVRGDHPITDNVSTADDDYAAHTRGANTGRIGISCAAMAGAVESPFNPGKFPLTEIQWNRMAEAIGVMCKFYGIPVTPKTVLTHAEVQGTLGIQQAGKWDFTRLAFDPSVKGAKACGDRLRAQVSAALAALK